MTSRYKIVECDDERDVWWIYEQVWLFLWRPIAVRSTVERAAEFIRQRF